MHARQFRYRGNGQNYLLHYVATNFAVKASRGKCGDFFSDCVCVMSVTFLFWGVVGGFRRDGFCVENVVDRSHGTSYLIFLFLSLALLS